MSTAPDPGAQESVETRRTSWMAVASAVLGLGGIFVVPFLLSPAAVLLGAGSIYRIRDDPQLRGRAVGVTGLVLGVVGLALFLGYAVLVAID